jgi:hypothetical protein
VPTLAIERGKPLMTRVLLQVRTCFADFEQAFVEIIGHPELVTNNPKNRSYPARSSTGGGVGKVILPTMRWQM